MHSILIMSFLLIFLESIIASDLDQDNLINNYRFPPIPIHHYDPVFSVIEIVLTPFPPRLVIL